MTKHSIITGLLFIILFAKNAAAQNVGIGTTTPTKAGLVVNQKVGATHAIFGDNTAGLSLESNYPAIGFNTYWSASNNRRMLNNGYGGVMVLDPNMGSFVLATTEGDWPTNDLPANMKYRLVINRFGSIGINGVNNPIAGLSFPSDLGNKISLWGSNATAHYGLGVQGFRLQLYVPSASENIVFGIGSSENFTENMRITGTGLVGIGNSLPIVAGLVVDKKVGAVNAIFGSNTTGVAIESSFPGIGLNSYFNGSRKLMANGFAGYMGMNPANGDLIFANSSQGGQATFTNEVVNRMVINSSGNVGIGNNLPNCAGLVVDQRQGRTNATFGSNRQGVSIFSNNPGIGFNVYDDGIGYKNIFNGFGGLLEMNGTSGILSYNVSFGSGTANGNTSLNTAFVVLPNRNVGIGIADPSATLHIQGSFRLQNGNQGVGKVLTSDAGGTATWSGPVAWVGEIRDQVVSINSPVVLASNSTLYGGVSFENNLAASGVVVVPVDGLYQINVHVKPYLNAEARYWAILQTRVGNGPWIELAGGERRQLYVNANAFPGDYRNQDLSYSILLPLVAGQQLRLMSAFTGVPPRILGTNSTPASNSYFSGFLVR
jgi:hypothetical protein